MKTKKISIEEHQRIMNELHVNTKQSVYREMDIMVKNHRNEKTKINIIWAIVLFVLCLFCTYR